MQSDFVVAQSSRCRSKRQWSKAVYTCNFALPDAFVGETSGKVATEIAVVNGFFASVRLLVDSDTMRHVDGGVLKNPVTRASQSGGGGRIPRAGRLKQVWVSAMRRHGSEGQASSTERNWCCDTVRLCFAQTFTKGQS